MVGKVEPLIDIVFSGNFVLVDCVTLLIVIKPVTSQIKFWTNLVLETRRLAAVLGCDREGSETHV